ncbi:hypothetical protein L798_12808 [Zootermopsis nevadensis]|uniref:Uncharacterized protein n=1 Tax=Zootermopsis nevadensis TaxID=136037 RepID=A0A067RS89_ZOONE|nr:hypothetical protein L798_12808 [Zootermopsis nevadensis]
MYEKQQSYSLQESTVVHKTHVETYYPGTSLVCCIAFALSSEHTN